METKVTKYIPVYLKEDIPNDVINSFPTVIRYFFDKDVKIPFTAFRYSADYFMIKLKYSNFKIHKRHLALALDHFNFYLNGNQIIHLELDHLEDVEYQYKNLTRDEFTNVTLNDNLTLGSYSIDGNFLEYKILNHRSSIHHFITTHRYKYKELERGIRCFQRELILHLRSTYSNEVPPNNPHVWDNGEVVRVRYTETQTITDNAALNRDLYQALERAASKISNKKEVVKDKLLRLNNTRTHEVLADKDIPGILTRGKKYKKVDNRIMDDSGFSFYTKEKIFKEIVYE